MCLANVLEAWQLTHYCLMPVHMPALLSNGTYVCMYISTYVHTYCMCTYVFGWPSIKYYSLMIVAKLTVGPNTTTAAVTSCNCCMHLGSYPNPLYCCVCACDAFSLVTSLSDRLNSQYKPPALKKKKSASADPSGRSAPPGSSIVMKQSNFGQTYKLNGRVEDGPDSSVGTGMHARSGSVRGSVVVANPPSTKKPPTSTAAVRKTAFSSGVSSKGSSGGAGDRAKGGSTTFSKQQSQRLQERGVESRIDSDSLESLSRVSLQDSTAAQVQPQRNEQRKRSIVRLVRAQQSSHTSMYTYVLCLCRSWYITFALSPGIT